MDIRILRYFLEVAKEGNITKAAEKLHITQPTLSRQMHELEDELGTSLLVRGKRQITLTDNGILLQQRAKELVGLFDKTRRDMAESNEEIAGVISIGCVESIASRMLSEVITEFKKLNPMVKYEIYSADGDDIREKLDRGDIDMGILIEPVEAAKYDYIRLPFYEQWGILVNSTDPLAKKKSIRLDEIKELPLIIPRRRIVQDEIEKWLGVEEQQLNIVASHNLLTNAILLQQSGLGYIICVNGAEQIRKTHDIIFVPFQPAHTSGHVLAWLKNKRFCSATSLFLQFIKDKY